MQNLEIFSYPIEPPKVSETSLQWNDLKNEFSFSNQNSYRPDLLTRKLFKNKLFILCGVIIAVDTPSRSIALKMSPSLTQNEKIADCILTFPRKRNPQVSVCQPYSTLATFNRAEIRENYPPLFYFDDLCVVEELESINDKMALAKKNEVNKYQREFLKFKENLSKNLTEYLTWTSLLLSAGSANPYHDAFLAYFRNARVTLSLKITEVGSDRLLCLGNPSERKGSCDVVVLCPGIDLHDYKSGDFVIIEGNLVSLGFDPRRPEPHRVEASSLIRSTNRAFLMSKDITMRKSIKTQHYSLYQSKLTKWTEYLRIEKDYAKFLTEKWLHGEAKMGIMGPVETYIQNPAPIQKVENIPTKPVEKQNIQQQPPQQQVIEQQQQQPAAERYVAPPIEQEPWIPRNVHEIFPTSPSLQQDDNTSWMSVIDMAMASAPAHQVYREEDDPSSQLYLERIRREQEIEERIKSEFIRKQNEDLIALEKNFTDIDIQPDPLAEYGLTKSQNRSQEWDFDADPFAEAPSYQSQPYQATYDTSNDPYLSSNPYQTPIDQYTPDVNSYILSSETPKIDLFGAPQQKFDDLDNLDFDFSKQNDYNYY